MKGAESVVQSTESFGIVRFSQKKRKLVLERTAKTIMREYVDRIENKEQYDIRLEKKNFGRNYRKMQIDIYYRESINDAKVKGNIKEIRNLKKSYARYKEGYAHYKEEIKVKLS